MGIIEVKKQDRFHISEHDKLKLLYFLRKGISASIVTTAPTPKRSETYGELINKGVRIFHVAYIHDLKETVKQLKSECT